MYVEIVDLSTEVIESVGGIKLLLPDSIGLGGQSCDVGLEGCLVASEGVAEGGKSVYLIIEAGNIGVVVGDECGVVGNLGSQGCSLILILGELGLELGYRIIKLSSLIV